MNLLRLSLNRGIPPHKDPLHLRLRGVCRTLASARRPRLVIILLVALAGAVELSGWVLAHRGPGVAAAVDKVPDAARLTRDVAALEKKLAALAPKGQYVVIDTARNQVTLRRGEEIQASMLASCGSGNVLEDPAGGRTWVFETPRGVFQVNSKVNKPVWIKPDWAFIEEGEEIPKNQRDRAVAGMLGDHAIGIGRGYFIHGTLYKRMLGRNVSHGCVRLGDEDLKQLVKTVQIGTRVVIF